MLHLVHWDTEARCFRDAFFDHGALPEHVVPVAWSSTPRTSCGKRPGFQQLVASSPPAMITKWVPFLAAATLINFTSLSLYAVVASRVAILWRLVVLKMRSLAFSLKLSLIL